MLSITRIMYIDITIVTRENILFLHNVKIFTGTQASSTLLWRHFTFQSQNFLFVSSGGGMIGRSATLQARWWNPPTMAQAGSTRAMCGNLYHNQTNKQTLL